jgi:ABC-type sugar transport system substrate-binding protein
MTRRRHLTAAALAGLSALALAACGSSSSSSSTGTSTAAAQASSSVKLGPKGAPETIGWLDAQVSAPIQTRYYTLAQQAASALGWKIDFQNMDGNVPAAATDMAGLLANHVKAIITSAIEPSWITQQLAAAKKAGVPVIQVGGSDGPDPAQYKGAYAGVYTENETQLAAPLATTMASQLAGGGQWGAVLTPLEYDSAARFAEVKSALEKNPKIQLVATDNVSLTDRVATAAADIKSMVEAHPNIKAIFGGLDFVTLAASEALRETNLAGKVKVYSFYVEPGNKSLMQANPPTLNAVSDGNQAQSVLVGINQIVNQLLLKKQIQFSAAPLTPYFYKVYTGADYGGVVGDEGPQPFNTMLAPYLAQWKSEGVLAK